MPEAMIDATAFRSIVSGQRRGILASLVRCGLAIVEIPYRLVVESRNRRFAQNPSLARRVDVPVICVGNLTLGGTGKTPFVAWLARWFRNRNVRVCIVSRGYGAKDGGRNDEARELESRLPDVPHLQNPERYVAASIAIEELETELVLLDDGFQHRRLHRDLNVLLVDATEPFGFGRVFPRGTLREPLHNAGRADLIVITKCEGIDEARADEIELAYREHAPLASFARVEQRPSALLKASGQLSKIETIHGKRVGAFCAIGNPLSFRSTLERIGCNVIAFREFPDHHEFDRSDIDSLRDWSREADTEVLICTHKDLVKLNVDRLGDVPLSALLIELDFRAGKNELEQRLESVLSELPPADPSFNDGSVEETDE